MSDILDNLSNNDDYPKKRGSSSRDKLTPRRYWVLLQFDQCAAALWDQRFYRIINAIGTKTKGDYEAYGRIWLAGCDAVEAALKKIGAEDVSALDKTLSEIYALREEKRKTIELYEALGLDGFVDWCIQHNVDWQAVLDDYNVSEKPLSWSENARQWLKTNLKIGVTYSTEEVKQAAIEARILDTSTPENLARDWSKMRQVALREKITTAERGAWCYKPLDQYTRE